MIGLIYNEVSKIVAQRRFIVTLVFMTIIAIAFALLAHIIHVSGEQIPATAATSVSGGVTASSKLLFPFLFAIIIGDSVAGELSAGTMKLLLIRPVSRWKIWISKLFAAFLVCAATVLYYGICSYVALGATIGFGSWLSPLGGDNNITTSAGVATLDVYALEMASVFSIVCFFQLISTLVQTGVAAVALCAATTIVFSIVVPIVGLVAQRSPNGKYFEYFFFEHWQIASHVTNTFPAANWTITGSLVTLGIWSALFIAASITIFQLKDVKS